MVNMAYDDNADIDWTKAQQLLEQQRAAASAAQTPAADVPGGSWTEALNLLQRNKQQVPERAMPAAEAPPSKDDAKTYWAMALSLLGNNGKDLGAILQNSADSYNKRLSAWEGRNSPDAQLDRQYKLAQLSAADRAAASEPLKQATEVAGVLRGDKNDAEQVRQFGARAVQDATLHEAELLGRKAGDELSQSGQDRRQGQQLDAQRSLEGMREGGADQRLTRELEGRRSLQDAAQAAETERAAAHDAAQLQIHQATEAAKRGAPIPGLIETDPARRSSLSPEEKIRADEEAVAGLRGQQKYAKLRQLMMSPYTTANEKEYGTILDALIGSESKSNATNSLQNVEYLRALNNKPTYAALTSGWGKLQQVSGGRGTWEAFSGQNPNLQYLNQLQAQHLNDANTALGVYGYGLQPPKQSNETAPTPVVSTGYGAASRTLPAPQQQQPAFNPQAMGMKGVWQPAGAPQAPAQVAQPQPAPTPEPIMPQLNVGQLQANGGNAVQLRPMRNAAGKVAMPVSLQETAALRAQGFEEM
jgi:hypothetical protein